MALLHELVLITIACLVLIVQSHGMQLDDWNSYEQLKKKRELEDMNSESNRFWIRQLQNSGPPSVPTLSPSSNAPTNAPTPTFTVSISQTWCGATCLDADDLNGATTLSAAIASSVAGDGQDISGITVDYSNGGPCGDCGGTSRRRLQGAASKEVIITITGLDRSVSPTDIVTSIKENADSIKTAIENDPFITLSGIFFADFESIIAITNSPTFTPTSFPTFVSTTSFPTNSPTSFPTNAPTPIFTVSVRQPWCASTCINADDLNGATTLSAAIASSVAADGQDGSTFTVTYSNGGPCGKCGGTDRRKLQDKLNQIDEIGEPGKRDIIITIIGIKPKSPEAAPVTSAEVSTLIIKNEEVIKRAIENDPVILVDVVVDFANTIAVTNSPTFEPTSFPTNAPTTLPTPIPMNEPTIIPTEAIISIPTKAPIPSTTNKPTMRKMRSKKSKRERFVRELEADMVSDNYDDKKQDLDNNEDDASVSDEIQNGESSSSSIDHHVVNKQRRSTHLQDEIYTRHSPVKEHIFEKDFTLPVYYVNLDRSTDRQIHMESFFANVTQMGYPIKLTRVSAKNTEDVEQMVEEGLFVPNGIKIVPTDGEESWLKHQRKEYPSVEVAVLLSHLYTILQAYKDGYEVVLILEDDALVKDEFFSDWQEYVKMAPSDWKILQWATSNDAVLKHTSQYVNDPWISWQPEYYAATGFMISRAGMEEVLRQSRKKTENGIFYWHIEVPELIVADEVVYYLAGGAYTSTFPWISTTGLASTFGESEDHPIFKSDNFEYKPRRLTVKSKERILILMSCRLSNEAQIIEEADRLQADIESFSKLNSNVQWIVNAVIADQHLKPIFERKMSSLKNLSIEIRSHVDSNPFNKFRLVAKLVDEMDQFDYVLIKDNDMRLSGFPWNTFMEKKGDSVVSGALHQGLEESLARSLGQPKRQYYEFHEGQMWKYSAVSEYTSLTPIPTLFIEHGFALLEAEFAAWYFNQVLDTNFISQRSDWGVDKMWCEAARTFHPNKPSCTLVPIVIRHDDTRQLSVSDDSEIFGRKAFQHFRKIPQFRNWMDATIGWEHFIGDDSTLDKVLERCRALLYSGSRTKVDLSTCASLIVGGEQNMPGNIYTCGWDILALNVFPDFTYSGVWTKDGKFYTEKDVIVADFFGSCVSTGDVKTSFAYMAEHFPGKILYVNGESHGNIVEYGDLDKGKRSFQVGPWHGDEYARSTQVYLAAMTLFVVNEEQWNWIFDPTLRKINNGKHHAIAYFVSNCVPYRQNAAKELSNIVELHHGGGCHVKSENSRQVEAEHHVWTSNWKLFRDYKYCLVMENKAQTGYITEKIIMAFLGGCIPIYYGTEEVFDLFNPESFVFYDINNPESALEKMRLLEESPEAYHKVLERPILRDRSVTIERFFSLSDIAPGNPVLKSRIRTMMGLTT